MKRIIIGVILAILIGVLVYLFKPIKKHDMPPIFNITDGTTQAEVESILGEPLSIDVDSDHVFTKLQGLYEQILATNKSLNTDANKEKRTLLEEILAQEPQNIDLISMNYKVVEKTPDGDHEFVRILYFYNGKLILNQ